MTRARVRSAMLLTRGSSALRMAVPSGGRHSTSLPFSKAVASQSPECGVVVVANRRHHADLRAQQPKRLRQGSWTPRSDLANAEPRLWTHLPEHVAPVCLESKSRRVAGTGPLQNRRRQVPCGCLAATAGDGDEGDVTKIRAAAADGRASRPLLAATSRLQLRRWGLKT